MNFKSSSNSSITEYALDWFHYMDLYDKSTYCIQLYKCMDPNTYGLSINNAVSRGDRVSKTANFNSYKDD